MGEYDRGERARFCSACSKNVYNISDMTKNEAEAFLRQKGASVCLRFYRRSDGTIMTDDCPVGLRRLRDRYRKLARLVSTGCSLFLVLVGTGGRAKDLDSEDPRNSNLKQQEEQRALYAERMRNAKNGLLAFYPTSMGGSDLLIPIGNARDGSDPFRHGYLAKKTLPPPTFLRQGAAKRTQVVVGAVTFMCGPVFFGSTIM